MDAIVAVYADWGIGLHGTQPVVLSIDRRHFAELTRGAAVIVGRRTMEDFPGGKPLRGRHNIVVTRQSIELDGAETAHSTEEALKLAEKYERCFVIGGASIYMQFLPHIDRFYITKIDLTPHSDRFLPDLDQSPDWRLTEQSESFTENGISCRFLTYERID